MRKQWNLAQLYQALANKGQADKKKPEAAFAGSGAVYVVAQCALHQQASEEISRSLFCYK